MLRTDSYPLGESVFFKGSLAIGLLSALWFFVPSLVAGGALYASAWIHGEAFDHFLGVLLLVVLALCTLIMQPARNIASQLTHRTTSMAIETFGRWLVLLFVLFAIGFTTKSTPDFARRTLLTWALVTPALIVLAHLGIRKWMRVLTCDVALQRRVLFAGYNESSLSLARRIERTPALCMRVAGFFDDRSASRLGYPDVTLLGNLRALAGYARQSSVDVIFVALPIRHLQRVLDLMDDLRDTTASIYYVPDIFSYDLIQARTGEISGVPVVALCETPIYGLRGLSKRLFDVAVATSAVVLLSPVFLIIAAAIRATSRGPALFRQTRYGLDGKKIVVLKFRTMTVTDDGEDVPQATKGDKRVTALGALLRRFSLDELPQLLNVIQGTMSLVGPRPHAVAHNETYRKLIKGYMVRHKVLPGITGLAQINGFRGETKEISQMEARVRYDLEYLRRWSIVLDLQIIGRTLLRMFIDEHAY